MRAWEEYHTPATVKEALRVLQDYGGRARVIGGGTDLLVEARRGLRRPFEALVDVSRIEGMDSICREQDYIVIGCGVTHTEIVNDERIMRHGTCLAEGCNVIGGPQVRNTGTLAGNVAHALPAGDGTIGLLALRGDVEIATASGTRWMPAKDTFVGPGKSVIDRHREVLTRLRFKSTGPAEGSAYHRVMRPQGLCLPIVSMAACLKMEGDLISSASISMGPVGPVPWFADVAAGVLVGDAPTPRQFEKAVDLVLANITLRTSKYRATEDYRKAMIRTCLPAILAKAAARAGAFT